MQKITASRVARLRGLNNRPTVTPSFPFDAGASRSLLQINADNVIEHGIHKVNKISKPENVFPKAA